MVISRRTENRSQERSGTGTPPPGRDAAKSGDPDHPSPGRKHRRHTHQYGISGFCTHRSSGARAGQKVIYYGHSTEADFRNSFHGSNLLAPVFKQWIKFCYTLGDVVLTPTEYAKALLQSYGIQRPIHVISNGVDTDFFAPCEARGHAFRQKYRLSAHEKVVISVGHYIQRKGILDFIELARRMPSVRFFWFGYSRRSCICSRQVFWPSPPWCCPASPVLRSC